MPAEPNPILSAGTQVVATVAVRGTDGRPAHPAGAVGVVVQSPSDYWHSYRVRFVDGFEASLGRADLAILSHYQQGNARDPLSEHDLYDSVVYRCVVGSRAYGLDHDGSDHDRRGIYLPPADRHWSLYGVPEQLETPGVDEVYWEFQKFLVMALKANPNVLECLYTPIIEHTSPVAGRLLEMRSAFLSKLVYQTYNGYVASQFKKLKADLRNKGGVKWKHPMHLLRLLMAGVRTLDEGVVPVHVGEHRERLLAIRRGEVSFEEIEAWRLRLHADFDRAYERTALPDRPDYAAVNALLLDARRQAAGGIVGR